jgi:uncharacterized tellurite resistance protein B-like protein
MDKLLFKKVNLLVHLANVDGKFHQSERDFLKSILVENGLGEKYLEEHTSVAVNFENFSNLPGKSELLFWSLKLIHADGVLHADELAFAKTIAMQLGFEAKVIDHFQGRPLSTLAEFEKEVEAFQTSLP